MISAAPSGGLINRLIMIMREAKDMKKKISSNGKLKGQPSSVNTNGTVFHDQIACKAYELYQERGEIHGHDLDDWLTAESLLQGELRSAQPAAKVSQRKGTPRKKNGSSARVDV